MRGLSTVYSYLIGGYREDRSKLFLEVNGKRGNGETLEHGKYQLDIRVLDGGVRVTFFVPMRLVEHRLHKDTLESMSLEVVRLS